MQTTSQLTPFPRRLRYAGTERHVELESLVPTNTSGRYCDLFRGIHSTLGTLALKRPRIIGSAYSDQQVHRFWQEAWTWKDLKHPNILPFFGILEAEGHIYLMSPWMVNGSLPSYLRTHPSDTEKLRLIQETAEAVAYLHLKGIVHGDIKGGNILVSSDIRAMLCDFGLTKMVDSVTTSSLQGAGSTPWMSPELMTGESKTFSSDVYAFGMTLYEIVIGKIPFAEYGSTHGIIVAVVVQKKRPVRDKGDPFCSPVYKPLWNLVTRCWAEKPSERPPMPNVAEELTPAKSRSPPVISPLAPQPFMQGYVQEFAKRYFSIHETGLIFKRKVPVERMVSWQKEPLQGPLLVLNRSLHKDATRSFKVIQKVMGDGDSSDSLSLLRIPGAPTTSPRIARETNGVGSVKEEERWMLNQGLINEELRDELYCQLTKQLSSNPSQESIVNGWHLLCVILNTFPPSKNLKEHLRNFLQEGLNQTEGMIDVMAEYCLGRLAWISKKGARGKPPTIQEIKAAEKAAFDLPIFGGTIESMMRLQRHTDPESKVPIILPFLTDAIIALDGSKRIDIFLLPGDADVVSEMELRIDTGHYDLTGVVDPRVPAALLEMWLRRLQEPVIPLDTYGEAIAAAEEPEDTIRLVKKLPTLNRRVLLFVISFLQLFFSKNVSAVAKMTRSVPASVMARYLLRCNSDSLAVRFDNIESETAFANNMLFHLKCDQVDSDYIPTHRLPPRSPSNSAWVQSESSRRRPLPWHS